MLGKLSRADRVLICALFYTLRVVGLPEGIRGAVPEDSQAIVSPSKASLTGEAASILGLDRYLQFEPEARSTWQGTVCTGNTSAWAGLTCTSGHVTQLKITGLVVGGVLPPDLASLTQLSVLECCKCNLTGTLPAKWLDLNQSLSVINVSGNHLTGSLPAAWAGLNATLRELNVGVNDLSGSLPQEYGSLHILKYFFAGNNSLTGTLPASFGNMATLRELGLEHNQLSGTLPDAWGGMSSAEAIALVNNKLSGTLPGFAWSLRLTALQKLNLRRNRLSGSLPRDWIGGPPDPNPGAGASASVGPNVWPRIWYIDLRYNDMNGSFPDATPATIFRQRNLNPYGDEHDPTIFLEPMNPGFGLCGPLPKNAPRIAEKLNEDWAEQDVTQLLALPRPCPGTEGASRWTAGPIAGVVIGCIAAAALVAMPVLIYAWPRESPEQLEAKPEAGVLEAGDSDYPSSTSSTRSDVALLRQHRRERERVRTLHAPGEQSGSEGSPAGSGSGASSGEGGRPHAERSVGSEGVGSVGAPLGEIRPASSGTPSGSGGESNGGSLGAGCSSEGSGGSPSGTKTPSEGSGGAPLTGDASSAGPGAGGRGFNSRSFHQLQGMVPFFSKKGSRKAAWRQSTRGWLRDLGPRTSPTGSDSGTSAGPPSMAGALSSDSGGAPTHAGTSPQSSLAGGGAPSTEGKGLVGQRSDLASTSPCSSSDVPSSDTHTPMGSSEIARVFLGGRSTVSSSEGLATSGSDSGTLTEGACGLGGTGGTSGGTGVLGDMPVPDAWKALRPLWSSAERGTTPAIMESPFLGLESRPSLLPSHLGVEPRFSLSPMASALGSSVELRENLMHNNMTAWREISEASIVFSLDATGSRHTLGHGSFGKVYKAQWHGTDIAVKMMLEEGGATHKPEPLAPGPDGVGHEVEEWEERELQRSNFEKEAGLLANLRHPNIVNFLGTCKTSEGMMVVTELCPGGDLARAMRRHRHSRAMSWETRGAKLALDIAKGLAYLHKMQVVHYDIKPGNILLDKSGSSAKISDVGMSRSLQTLVQGSQSVRGTLDYMAPEVMMKLPATTASDIYSFGIVMWQLITGEEPDRRQGPLRELKVPDMCSAAVADLCWSCLGSEPSTRPSAEELAEKLRSLQPPRRSLLPA